MSETTKHVFKFRKEYNQKYGAECGDYPLESEQDTEETAENIEEEYHQEYREECGDYPLESGQDTEEIAETVKEEDKKIYHMCKYYSDIHPIYYRCNSPGNLDSTRKYYKDARESVRFEEQCRRCNVNGVPLDCEFYAEPYVLPPEETKVEELVQQEEIKAEEVVQPIQDNEENSILKEGLNMAIDIVTDPVKTILKETITKVIS